ncbi:MAG: hypothetical protein JJ885_12940 [Muricauda sp.]|nr:hypothetical protein [Allomuricauda sp.]MBO6532716.1 hypothetical protein [Allomuricauda sp.]MBO6590187.1 hypothetical protein [Allomuricauda sp.]MBO6619665.1 hypothetical protein [Allomuricauda sp.]MBO6645708.1 hypothetical protein [Allomuricauda sp.]MBO6748003.1 hypothetical protein [Allomuricauda sp.]
MKFSERLYGQDYTAKLEEFRSKVSAIKESYDGDFDTDNPMYTMQTHQTKGEVKLIVDKNVPTELKRQIVEAFDSAWN